MWNAASASCWDLVKIPAKDPIPGTFFLENQQVKYLSALSLLVPYEKSALLWIQKKSPSMGKAREGSNKYR
jgi:hypothetical protein